MIRSSIPTVGGGTHRIIVSVGTSDFPVCGVWFLYFPAYTKVVPVVSQVNLVVLE